VTSGAAGVCVWACGDMCGILASWQPAGPLQPDPTRPLRMQSNTMCMGVHHPCTWAATLIWYSVSPCHPNAPRLMRFPFEPEHNPYACPPSLSLLCLPCCAMLSPFPAASAAAFLQQRLKGGIPRSATMLAPPRAYINRPAPGFVQQQQQRQQAAASAAR
jgi:hypothetical protein